MLTDKKILAKLEPIRQAYAALRFEKVADVALSMTRTRDHFRAEPARQAGLNWRPIRQGQRWGGSGVTGWFRGDVRLGRACGGRKIFLRAETGAPETMLLVDGRHQGVFDANHPVVMMTATAAGGRKYHLSFEAYCGHSFPGTGPYEAPRVVADNSCVFGGAEILLEREDVSGFVFDLAVLKQLVDLLDENSLRRNRIAAGLGEVYGIIDAVPQESPEPSWRGKLAGARKVMARLLSAGNSATCPVIGLIGHAHLDTAWLWPIAETWRKAARTFSSMLNLMEQYPELTFIQSAPCHTEAVRREYPGIYRRMRKMVASGRWEPNGAAWVEPDCNIPSGESLVRQLLLGQSATRAMFGYTSDTLWLPDVFGYSGALPQILRGCDVEFFCTTKMAWNDTTRFPYDTFVWRGIDGTGVLAHFNAIHCRPDPKTITDQWNRVLHKDRQGRRLCAFGFGDGGGGPQAEMMEIARRLPDLEGCPRTEYTTVSRFMKSVRDESPDLPVWSGELYLEAHRGTLTSIAEMKRGNRKAEFALRDAELLATLAAMRGRRYPGAKLLKLWKVLLTNQFHDILPGSSIAEVNDEAVSSLARCGAGAKEVSRSALAGLFGPARAGASGVRIVNTLSWDLTGEIALEGAGEGMRPADREIAAQWVSTVEGNRRLVVSGLTVPGLGSASLSLVRGRLAGGRSPFKVTPNTVQTPSAKVRFDKAGRIVSFVDRASGRQIVKSGGALNVLLIGQDVPAGWDNWDIDADQGLKMRVEDRLVRRRVSANGPLQLRIRSEYKVGRASRLVQDVVFHARTPRVDFETVVHWSEKRKLLKTGFDLDVLSDFARHEVQFGHVARPTHLNLPRDRARFEVCAHKWTDLSETGFGVALLNDCKYGLGVCGGQLRLTLLKSGVHPDARGDAGTHVMTYSLLPHACGFSVESVVRPAYELNAPPIVRAASAPGEELTPIVSLNSPNVIVESVKWAQRGKAFVLRLYEASKTGTRVRLRFAPGVKGVHETNMLEEAPRGLARGRGGVSLYFRPFEIKTLRCEL